MSYQWARDQVSGWRDDAHRAIEAETEAVNSAAMTFNTFLASKAVPDSDIEKMVMGVLLDVAIGAVPGGLFLSRFWKDRTAGLTEVGQEVAKMMFEKGYNFADEVRKKYGESAEKAKQATEGKSDKAERPAAFIAKFLFEAKRPLLDARRVVDARAKTARDFITYCEEKKYLARDIERLVGGTRTHPDGILGVPPIATNDDYLLAQMACTYALFGEYVKQNVVVEVVINTYNIEFGNSRSRTTRYTVKGIRDGKEKDIYDLFGSKRSYVRSDREVMNQAVVLAAVEGARRLGLNNSRPMTSQEVFTKLRNTARQQARLLPPVDDPEDLVRVFGARKVVHRSTARIPASGMH